LFMVNQVLFKLGMCLINKDDNIEKWTKMFFGYSTAYSRTAEGLIEYVAKKVSYFNNKHNDFEIRKMKGYENDYLEMKFHLIAIYNAVVKNY
jgi:hypothetical protein